MKDIVLEAIRKAKSKKKPLSVVIRYLRMRFRVLLTEKELESRGFVE